MKLDPAVLAQYLQTQGFADSQQLQVSALTGGQSNPTYRLTLGTGAAEKSYVLRKQPSGALLPGAHAVDREYRVMRALHGSAVPVPQMLCYCDDASLLGTPFYLMEWVEGRVFVDQSLPNLSGAERQALYWEMNRVIAALHNLDYQALGLADYGKAGNYFARQISRWSRQSLASKLPVSPAMRNLIDWLPEHIPADDETSLVHGDFRMDNLVFHATEARVLAVLDWELSTLGHPLADFSYQCMSWRVPPTLWRGIGGLDLAALQIPSEEEYIARYAEATGRERIENWDFYQAYNLFRMSAILHGIAERALQGNAAATDAVAIGQRAEPLAELAWQCAQKSA